MVLSTTTTVRVFTRPELYASTCDELNHLVGRIATLDDGMTEANNLLERFGQVLVIRCEPAIVLAVQRSLDGTNNLELRLAPTSSAGNHIEAFQVRLKFLLTLMQLRYL